MVLDPGYLLVAPVSSCPVELGTLMRQVKKPGTISCFPCLFGGCVTTVNCYYVIKFCFLLYFAARSTVFLPAKVVHALNLNLDGLNANLMGHSKFLPFP